MNMIGRFYTPFDQIADDYLSSHSIGAWEKSLKNFFFFILIEEKRDQAN